MPTTRTEDEAAARIMDAINCMSHDEATIGTLLANDHPTLQQSFMRVVIGYLREMAGKPYVDARNQAAHDLAKKMLEDLAPDDLALPLI